MPTMREFARTHSQCKKAYMHKKQVPKSTLAVKILALRDQFLISVFWMLKFPKKSSYSVGRAGEKRNHVVTISEEQVWNNNLFQSVFR